MGIGKVIDINSFILNTERGINNGVATLDSSGNLLGTQLNVGTSGIEGVLPISNGGTGLSSITPDRVLLADFSTSNNLQWDNTNNYLGIGGTPSYTLDVYGTSRFNNVITCTNTNNSISELTGAISIPNGGIGIGSDCYVKGFINFDGLPFKVEVFRGITASVAGGTTDLSIAPIDITKIISIYTLVDYSSSGIGTWITSSTKSGYQHNTYINSDGLLRIELTDSNSNSILNKPFVTTIAYTS